MAMACLDQGLSVYVHLCFRPNSHKRATTAHPGLCIVSYSTNPRSLASSSRRGHGVSPREQGSHEAHFDLSPDTAVSIPRAPPRARPCLTSSALPISALAPDAQAGSRTWNTSASRFHHLPPPPGRDKKTSRAQHDPHSEPAPAQKNVHLPPSPRFRNGQLKKKSQKKKPKLIGPDP